MNKYLLIYILFINFTYLQDCNDNDFVLGENGEQWLKVNNTSCKCKSFVGDGSQLSNINNVMLKVRTNTSQFINKFTYTKLEFNIVMIDTYNGWDLINNIYNIPITGYYLITAFVLISQTDSLSRNTQLGLVINGNINNGILITKDSNLINYIPLSFPGITYLLNKNDTIYLYIYTDISNITIFNGMRTNWFNLVLLSKL